jgi:hypothetical protein
LSAPIKLGCSQITTSPSLTAPWLKALYLLSAGYDYKIVEIPADIIFFSEPLDGYITKRVKALGYPYCKARADRFQKAQTLCGTFPQRKGFGSGISPGKGNNLFILQYLEYFPYC